MNERVAQKIYSARASLYHFFIHVVGYARGVKNFFAQSSYLKPSLKILDAGCGGGLITKILWYLARKKNTQNITFHGFDLTPAMLDRFKSWIKKSKIKNIQLIQADVLKPAHLPKNWNNYDAITVSGMLEHLPKEKITQAIQNLHCLLKSNGTLLIFICRKNWLAHFIITKWWKAHTYTKKEISDILRIAGFSSLSFKRFSFPFSYLNSWIFIIEAQKKET